MYLGPRRSFRIGEDWVELSLGVHHLQRSRFLFCAGIYSAPSYLKVPRLGILPSLAAAEA
jgi:hypothetical protein